MSRAPSPLVVAAVALACRAPLQLLAPQDPPPLRAAVRSSGDLRPAMRRTAREIAARTPTLTRRRLEALERFVQAMAPLCAPYGTYGEPGTVRLRCDYDVRGERGMNPSHTTLAFESGRDRIGRRTVGVLASAGAVLRGDDIGGAQVLIAGFVDRVPAPAFRAAPDDCAIRGGRCGDGDAAGHAEAGNDCLAWSRARRVACELIRQRDAPPGLDLVVVGGSTARMAEHEAQGGSCTRVTHDARECGEGRRVDLLVTLQAAVDRERQACRSSDAPAGLLFCLERVTRRPALRLGPPIGAAPRDDSAGAASPHDRRLHFWHSATRPWIEDASAALRELRIDLQHWNRTRRMEQPTP